MRFWDSSALVPLLVSESSSEVMARTYRDDRVIVVAWTTAIECVSACMRKHRAKQLSESHLAQILDRLRDLRAEWIVAEPTVDVASTAERIVARHNLRAADAIQLASAIATSSPAQGTVDIVCLDRRLAHAASTEGFRILPDLPR
jgi:predicted nucleic acid-binding protein